jgi:hypothetical protein|tara:strand:+ start:180 stop:401 length:222 start_codon:yes stop_codon:yes gene_type:complete
MIPSISYKFYCSHKYLEWKKCVIKEKKAGNDIKKCNNIYTAYLLLNENTIHRDDIKKNSSDPPQIHELPKKKL